MSKSSQNRLCRFGDSKKQEICVYLYVYKYAYLTVGLVVFEQRLGVRLGVQVGGGIPLAPLVLRPPRLARPGLRLGAIPTAGPPFLLILLRLIKNSNVYVMY